MALLTCPECGKENVSSMAEACPVCGYNIKRHCEELEEEAAKRMMQEEEQRKTEQEERLNYQRVYNSVEMPEKPMRDWKEIVLTVFEIFFLVCLIIFIFAEVYTAIPVTLFGLVFIGIPTHGYWHDYSTKIRSYKENLNHAQRDFDSYRKKRVEELLGLQKGLDELVKHQAAIREATCYICPNCGRRGGRRISSLKKGTSVAVFGIASNALSKNYECDFCHYIW